MTAPAATPDTDTQKAAPIAAEDKLRADLYGFLGLLLARPRPKTR